MIGRPSPPGIPSHRGLAGKECAAMGTRHLDLLGLGAFVLFVATGLFLVAVVTGFFCDAVNNE
jgi:hypothetical protein